jgi:mRNA interferase MazF
MAVIARGDVVFCDLGPVVGAEQAGMRPAVVVQLDPANVFFPHTIVVPFTTKKKAKLRPSQVFVPAGVAGLPQDPVALCEQIRVLDMRKIVRMLGHLDPTSLDEIEKALRHILGL